MATSEESFVCAICLDFESDLSPDWFVTTPNGHIFHFNYCINEWISRGRTRCPLCDEELDTSNMTRLFGVDPSRRHRSETSGSTNSYSNDKSGESNYRELVLSSRKPDHTFNIFLLGNTGVGKSCLLQRYTSGAFNYTINSTIGCDVCCRTIKVGNKIIKLCLWDTAGQERYQAVTKNFVRNAHGVVLVYSYGKKDQNSLAGITQWLQFCKDNGLPDAAHILVGNKSDVPEDQRLISTQQGAELARKLGLNFFETSALDHYNIDALFRALVVEILQNLELQKLASKGANQAEERLRQQSAMQLVHVPKKDEKKDNSGCC